MEIIEVERMRYIVCAAKESRMVNPIFMESDEVSAMKVCHEEKEAIAYAEMFSLQGVHKNVFIFFQREGDGQTGFLNPWGYDPVTGENWINI